MKRVMFLCAWAALMVFFIGFINVDNKFDIIEIFIKYPPTMEFYFFAPAKAINELTQTEIMQLSNYDTYFDFYKAQGVAGQLLALSIVQLFLAVLLKKTVKPYYLKNLVYDVIFFLVTLFILGVALAKILHSYVAGDMVMLASYSAGLLVINVFVYRFMRGRVKG